MEKNLLKVFVNFSIEKLCLTCDERKMLRILSRSSCKVGECFSIDNIENVSVRIGCRFGSSYLVSSVLRIASGRGGDIGGKSVSQLSQVDLQ